MDATDARYSGPPRACLSWTCPQNFLNELARGCECGQNAGCWRCVFRGKQGDGLLAVDGAIFHYKGNLLQGGDVVEGIATNGDYVGGVAGFEDADFILPAQ